MSTAKRIKALQTVQQLATADKEQAAAYLQAQQQTLQVAQQQLQQLRSFYADYATAAGRLDNARQLQQYHVFLARLDRSIAQQQSAMTASQQAVDESRGRWASLYQRSEALDKALQKAQTGYARKLGSRH